MTSTAMILAIAHQRNMTDLATKIRTDASCIRQLLLGKTVRRKSDGVEFVVIDTRLGLAPIVTVHGKKRSGGRLTIIGTVGDIEIVEKTS
jgi:hypothetical protein